MVLRAVKIIPPHHHLIYFISIVDVALISHCCSSIAIVIQHSRISESLLFREMRAIKRKSLPRSLFSPFSTVQKHHLKPLQSKLWSSLNCNSALQYRTHYAIRKKSMEIHLVTSTDSSVISNRPWRGWTTACCLLGFAAFDCFLCSGAVLFLKTGSCFVFDSSPACCLYNMALLSNSLCFSLSSWEKEKKKDSNVGSLSMKKWWSVSMKIYQHLLNDVDLNYDRQGLGQVKMIKSYYTVWDAVFTWISLRDWATSFSTSSLSLSWQFIISLSRAISLSITDGSEKLQETKANQEEDRQTVNMEVKRPQVSQPRQSCTFDKTVRKQCSSSRSM